MVTLKRKRQFLTNEEGKRVAVLFDMKTYEQIEDALEELACIKEYDKAKPAIDEAMRKGDYVTVDEYISSR